MKPSVSAIRPIIRSPRRCVEISLLAISAHLRRGNLQTRRLLPAPGVSVLAGAAVSVRPWFGSDLCSTWWRGDVVSRSRDGEDGKQEGMSEQEWIAESSGVVGDRRECSRN